MLMQDHPILATFSITGMRSLDRLAFAAELLQLGYPYRTITKTAGCGMQTVCKLKVRMGRSGILPTLCPCGAPFKHRGNCLGWLNRMPH